MSRPRTVVALTAVLLLAVGALAWGDALTRDRTSVAATGTPAPVNEITPVPLGPGQLLCATDIVLGPRTQVAELIVEPQGRPSPPFAVRADAPAYRSPVVPVPAGSADPHAIHVRIQPPDRETYGRLCVRNKGRTTVAFRGTLEVRTYTKLRTWVDGKPLAPDVALTFYTARPTTALGDVVGIVDRMTANRGFLSVAWFAWLLLTALAVGVPLLMLRALSGALVAER